jgi:ribosomal protein S9
MRICDAAGGTHRRLRKVMIGVVTMVGTGALAASASAASIGVTKNCYVNVNPFVGAPVTLLGSGFGPGDTVDVMGGGLAATATASATGTIAAVAAAPTLSTTDPATKTFTLTATDETTPSVTASAPIKVANLSVLTKPPKVRHLRNKVTFSFSGFTPGKHIYGHYLRKNAVARATFGKAKGDCGVLKEKALLYPGGHPRFKQYKVVFDSARKYSKRTRPQISGTLKIGILF